MNGEDTFALWRQGKNAWESWRRIVLERKAALVATREWSVDWYGEGGNDQTKAWLEEATVKFQDAVFDENADFAGYQFPGPVNFDGARFAGKADFTDARFADNCSFEGAQFETSTFAGVEFKGFVSFAKAKFEAAAIFDKSAFLKSSDLAPSVRFYRAQFADSVSFNGTRFAGVAEFVKASFAAAIFNACEFAGDAVFNAAEFTGEADFTQTRFTCPRVDFAHAVFRGEARFAGLRFGGSWAGLAISGACSVSFETAQFDKGAYFRKSWFVGECEFQNAVFSGEADFSSALFVMPANFRSVRFAAGNTFRDAQFVREANFTDAAFLAAGKFGRTKFGAAAHFDQARLPDGADFERAEFKDKASFCGVEAGAAVVFTGAQCVERPDFTSAALKNEPDFRKLVILKPRKSLLGGLLSRSGEGSLAARWLRREQPPQETPADAPFEAGAAAEELDRLPGLALVAAVETSAATKMRSTSTADAPGAVQAETMRSGAPAVQEAYAVVGVNAAGNATISRPVAAMEALANPEEQARGAASRLRTVWRAPATAGTVGASAKGARRSSVLRPFIAWVVTVLLFVPFYLSQRPVMPPPPGAAPSSSVALLKAFDGAPCINGSSQPVEEALYLSVKNSLVLVPWENEHVISRVYGCLYGLDNSAPIIPVAVSLGALVQAILSFTFLAMLLIVVRERAKRR